ncbi:MAG TPA: hypothetical protein VGK59_18475 [Ohtaekwangia sp.]
MFTPYVIKNEDTFDEHRYPDVAGEIDGLRESLREISSYRKTLIVISLLKDHSIRAEWLEDNKLLVALINSGSLSTTHLESLFSACKHNVKFLSGLESCITRRLG